MSVTISIGQWDARLAAAYEAGFVLLEPVRAYQKAGAAAARQEACAS